MPYLVNAALRLADACDVVDAVVGSAALQAARRCTEKLAMCTVEPDNDDAATIWECLQGSDSVLFGRDAMQAGRSQLICSRSRVS